MTNKRTNKAKKSRRRDKSKFRAVRRGLLALTVACIATGIALTLPLRWLAPPNTAFMLHDERRTTGITQWRNFDALGENLVLAVVAAEDQRFATHMGLDFESIRGAVEERREGDRLRGASTITQQLVKNLYLWSGRSFLRKGVEAWLAVNLEVFVSKRRILELYLNVVEFGPGVYGAAEASRQFFGKEPALLSEREAALLAAVLPSPRRYRADAPTDYLRERQRWILEHIERLKRENWLLAVS